MADKQYAQNFPYWQTTIKPSKSKAEVDEILARYGARVVQITTGRLEGKEAWRIAFIYDDTPYQLVFHPLPLKQDYPTTKQEYQALCQMGRLAVYTIKNLMMIGKLQPAALFGFMAIPGPRGETRTTAELGVEGLVNILPELEFKPDTNSQKFEVKEDGEIASGQ